MARLSLALVAGLLLLALTGSPRADDQPADKDDKAAAAPAGTWKVYLPFLRDVGSQALWLLKLEKKDSDWSGEVLATMNRFPKATIQGLTVKDGLMTFTLKATELVLPCEVKLPKGGKGDKLYGTTSLRKRVIPLELEKTALTTLDSFEQLKESLAKQSLGQEAVQMALQLLGNAEAKKVKPVEVRAWAEKAVKSADLYGASLQRDVILQVAELLGEQKGFEAVALQYARRAERMLEPKEAPAALKRVLGVLASALEKAGKTDEAKEVAARVKKLDFRIKPKAFAGRKSKSDRVVLVELFTGAQLAPAQAVAMAFDALEKTYKPSEVVLLEYHLSTPQPDPLTCPDSEARAKSYDDKIRGLPTAMLNGTVPAAGGGGAEDASDRYEDYARAIEPLLEEPAKGEVKLTATRKGDKVNINVEVAKLAASGDDVRLRVVLVEEQVPYKGSNGVLVHHNVVRSMPGGEDGTVLKQKSAKKTFTVDVEALRKDLQAYLDKQGKKRPFPDKERPLDLKKLRVVAFVQDDRTLEVLQAAQADVKME